MKQLAGLFSLACALYLSACSAASPLDKALDDYKNWKSITITGLTQGNLTNVSSAVEYNRLFAEFQRLPSTQYPMLVKWVERHQKDVPAPLYWELAEKASQEKRPYPEIAKWMNIGQTYGGYDASRCRDYPAAVREY